MITTNSQIEHLKKMLALEQRREELQAELDSLTNQLNSLKGHLVSDVKSPAPTAAPASFSVAPRGGKRTRRGQLKVKIYAALHNAGSLGVKVKDLAAALGAKPVNIHSWFHSAVKANPSIVKVSGGHYRLKGEGSSEAAQPAPKTKVKATRRKGTKRGQLTASIVGELKAAGSKGITVSDLAKKLGADYKNIYIWFATTGKKQTGLKKLAPATYSLVS